MLFVQQNYQDKGMTRISVLKGSTFWWRTESEEESFIKIKVVQTFVVQNLLGENLKTGCYTVIHDKN